MNCSQDFSVIASFAKSQFEINIPEIPIWQRNYAVVDLCLVRFPRCVFFA